VTDLATLERDGPVARLTLNRPEARNALSEDLIDALRARVADLAPMEDVSVCVVGGAGRAFCAGMDLKAVLGDPSAARRLLSGIAELMIEVRSLPMVTVARVQGAAIGGGCGLMSVCDLAVTHEGAKLGYPEVDLGVCPAVVAPWLVEKIGAGAARRVLLSGGLTPAARALELGLVSAVAADAEALDAEVEGVVDRLRSASAGALRATKAWVNEAEGVGVFALVRRGAMISAEVLEDPGARAALSAAFGRR